MALENMHASRYANHVIRSLEKLTNDRQEFEAHFDRKRLPEYQRTCDEQIKYAVELIKLGSTKHEIDGEDVLVWIDREGDPLRLPQSEIREIIDPIQFGILFPQVPDDPAPEKEEEKKQEEKVETGLIYPNFFGDQDDTYGYRALFAPYLAMQGMMNAMADQFIRQKFGNSPGGGESSKEESDEYKKKLEKARENADELSKKVEDLKGALAESEQKSAKFAKGYKTLKEQIEQISFEADRKVANIQQSILTEKRKSDEESEKLRQEAEELKKKVQEEEKTLDETKKALEEEKRLSGETQSRLQKDLDRVNEAFNSEKETSDALRKENEDINKTISSLKDESSEHMDTIRKRDGEIRSLKESVESANKKAEKAEASLEAIKKEKNNLDRLLNEERQKSERLQKEKADAENRNTEKKDAEVKKLHGEIDRLSAEIKKITEKNKEAEEALREMKGTNKLLSDEKNSLVEANEMLSGMAYRDVKFDVGSAFGFHDKINSLNSEVKTIGIIDVLGMAMINQTYTEEVGDKVIRLTIEALNERFGSGNVFRTRGAQFSVTSDENAQKVISMLQSVQKNLENTQEIQTVFGVSDLSSQQPDTAIRKAEEELRRHRNRIPQKKEQNRYESAPQAKTAPSVPASPQNGYQQQPAPAPEPPRNPNITYPIGFDNAYEEEETVKETDTTSMDIASQILEMAAKKK